MRLSFVAAPLTLLAAASARDIRVENGITTNITTGPDGLRTGIVQEFTTVTLTTTTTVTMPLGKDNHAAASASSISSMTTAPKPTTPPAGVTYQDANKTPAPAISNGPPRFDDPFSMGIVALLAGVASFVLM